MAGHEREVRWHKLTRDEVLAAADASAVVIQPLGAIEQHGSHLPLDTDIYSCETVATRTARAASFPVLVAPPLWWGVSEYWMELGGTLPLRPELMADVLAEIIDGIARNGFERVLLLNGHAGNAAVIHTVAVRFLRRAVRVVGMHYWSLAADVMRERGQADNGSIGHAGEVETSLQLALRPDEVRHDLIGDDASMMLPRDSFPPEFAGKIIMPPNPTLESPGGVYGQPGMAQPAYGEAILAEVVSRLVEFLENYREFALPATAPREAESKG